MGTIQYQMPFDTIKSLITGIDDQLQKDTSDMIDYQTRLRPYGGKVLQESVGQGYANLKNVANQAKSNYMNSLLGTMQNAISGQRDERNFNYQKTLDTFNQDQTKRLNDLQILLGNFNLKKGNQELAWGNQNQARQNRWDDYRWDNRSDTYGGLGGGSGGGSYGGSGTRGGSILNPQAIAASGGSIFGQHGNIGGDYMEDPRVSIDPRSAGASMIGSARSGSGSGSSGTASIMAQSGGNPTALFSSLFSKYYTQTGNHTTAMKMAAREYTNIINLPEWQQMQEALQNFGTSNQSPSSFGSFSNWLGGGGGNAGGNTGGSWFGGAFGNGGGTTIGSYD